MEPKNTLTVTSSELASIEAIHAATSLQEATEKARLVQFQELAENLKEKTTVTLTLAENKAKSLIDSAAKDAANLIETARINALKLADASPSIAILSTDISYIKRDVGEIKTKLEKDYVTRDEFNPVKWLIFGLAGILLTGVIGAMLTLIIRK